MMSGNVLGKIFPNLLFTLSMQVTSPDLPFTCYINTTVVLNLFGCLFFQNNADCDCSTFKPVVCFCCILLYFDIFDMDWITNAVVSSTGILLKFKYCQSLKLHVLTKTLLYNHYFATVGINLSHKFLLLKICITWFQKYAKIVNNIPYKKWTKKNCIFVSHIKLFNAW